MDSTQKFIEEHNNSVKYEVDWWVFDTLSSLPKDVSLNIREQIEDNYKDLRKKDSWSQFVGGVVKREEPYFFEVEFINESRGVPVFLDVKPIDIDTYLDYINKKQTFKTYE